MQVDGGTGYAGGGSDRLDRDAVKAAFVHQSRGDVEQLLAPGDGAEPAGALGWRVHGR